MKVFSYCVGFFVVDEGGGVGVGGGFLGGRGFKGGLKGSGGFEKGRWVGFEGGGGEGCVVIALVVSLH